MKDTLAEKLLSHELNWDTAKAKEEIERLKFLASIKYDQYRNFEPGLRFLESLVLWLRQFNKLDEREAAYNFVVNRMLYISGTQLDHLLDLLFPQRIFPILRGQVTGKDGISPYKIKRIRTSETYKILLRKTLFLALSDSARMDSFRRKHLLNNEQLSVSYELSAEKWESMHKELKDWIEKNNFNSQPVFENIFLIDDFTGSGNSILKFDEKKKTFKGKLKRFLKDSLGSETEPGPLGQYCNEQGPNVFVVTSLATQKAITHLLQTKSDFIKSLEQPKLHTCEILEPLQILDENLKVPQPENKDDLGFDRLLEEYYDDRIEDEHTKSGGKDVKHGYAGCSLPLILEHNCPNNSVYLLWAQTDKTESCSGLQALFPRISRHLEER